MVAVLMSTYNGALYLQEQLESLLRQSFSDYKVFIHDDGSSDESISILRLYATKHPKKIVYIDDNKNNLGAYKSFMWLLEHIESDYYMFCDQDDIWFDDKIKDSYEFMLNIELQNPNIPVLIHTDLVVIDENKKTIASSYWQYRGFRMNISEQFRYLCFGNVVTGCTMMINRAARKVSFPINDYVEMHDFWIALMTAKHGIVKSLNKATMLYRKHGNNVTSFGDKYNKFNFIGVLNFRTWYKNNIPFFHSIGYGNITKVVFYRIIYFINRHFMT